ncbi:hypothetical protein CCYA_CCYA16G4115 [Cyanidiococcus yangmingshanensis]|nr:hypothetical protein CCYA_CCYA16G4115 [Cyanidiococcus yangmingshanensis]
MLSGLGRLLRSASTSSLTGGCQRANKFLGAVSGPNEQRKFDRLVQTSANRAGVDRGCPTSPQNLGRIKDEPFLLVSEIFSSIQGEGPFSGCPSVFLRLGLCNLECAWCDTKYTWLFQESRRDRIRARVEGKTGVAGSGSKHEPGDAHMPQRSDMLTVYDRRKELRKLSVQDVLEHIERATKEIGAEAVVITGGEPLLHAKPLSSVVPSLLEKLRLRVEFETNGTLTPVGLTSWSRSETPRVYFNVSPKLANSSQPVRQRLRWDVLQYFATELPNASAFKFVVDSEEDLAEVQQIVNRLKISTQRVWLMPQATTSAALAVAARERVIPWCLRHGFRYSHRIHVSIWDDRRGV